MGNKEKVLRKSWQIAQTGVVVKSHFTQTDETHQTRHIRLYLLSSSCFDLEPQQRERHKKAINFLHNT